MPINYKEYHPKWSLIRLLILKRAEHRCEHCGLPNHAIIRRGRGEEVLIVDTTELQYRIDQGQKKVRALKYLRLTEVVLTIAHLDHNKNNNRFYNLAALCQRCHLRIDRAQHTANRRYGRKHRDGQMQIEI